MTVTGGARIVFTMASMQEQCFSAVLQLKQCICVLQLLWWPCRW